MVLNFYAGPAALPAPVVERIHDDLTNFQGTGMGVMEISHRAPEIEFLIADAAERTRCLLGVGRDWEVVFVQGGGSLQFCMIPVNFSAPGDPVDYLDTGYWARKSIAEARLRPYLRLGARVLAGTAIGGEERFFLLWPIRELAAAAG